MVINLNARLKIFAISGNIYWCILKWYTIIFVVIIIIIIIIAIIAIIVFILSISNNKLFKKNVGRTSQLESGD